MAEDRPVEGDDALHRLVRYVHETKEDGFIRHLNYCLLYRHTPVRVPGAVGDSIWMLRLKRAAAELTAEGMMKYGLDPAERDRHEGWSVTLSAYDFEVMRMRRRR